jgi:hypothetical protein
LEGAYFLIYGLEDRVYKCAELAKPTFSKAGDLWHLGQYSLFCDDATKRRVIKIAWG